MREYAHQLSFDGPTDIAKVVSELHHWMDIKSVFEDQIRIANDEIMVRRAYIIDTLNVPKLDPGGLGYGVTQTALDCPPPTRLMNRLITKIKTKIV